MRKLLLAVSVVLLAFPAFAADLPPILTKAPVPGYPSKCGLYYGFNALGSGGTIANAPAGTTVIGGDIGATVGYACSLSGIPYFAEVMVDFQNLNASAPGFSLSGPAHIGERIGVQTPLMQFFPALGFPSTGAPPNLPVLPPGVTVTGAAQNYVYGEVDQDDISSSAGLGTFHAWLVSAGIGTGMLVPLKLANGWNAVADVWAGVKLQSNSICIGAPTCPKLGTGFNTGVSFKF